MADEVLVLNWAPSELLGIDARVDQGAICILKCFRLRWPDTNDGSMDAGDAGRWLRRQLDRLDIKTKLTHVSLPRNAVAVRYLELPEARDDQLPDLVRFSAATKALQPIVDLRVDYLRLPRRADQNGRAVLIHTVLADRVDQLSQTTNHAGLNLLSLGVASVASAECVAHIQQQRAWPAHEPTLIVAVDATRIDIIVKQQQFVLYSHSKHLVEGQTGGVTAAMVLAEVRRTLVALESRQSDLQVRRAVIVGADAENAQLQAYLREHLNCDVDCVDPVGDLSVEFLDAPPDGQTPGEELLGTLLSHQSPLVDRIDFLHPRHASAPRVTNKLRAGLIAATLLLLVVIYVAHGYRRIHQLDEKIAQNRELVRQLEDSVKRSDSVMDSAAQLSEWESKSRDHHWLHRMQAVSTQLPGTDKLYLTRLRFDQGQGDVVARVTANGVARQREDVESLYQRLADAVDLRVRPEEIRRDARRSDFPFRFALNVDVLPTEDNTARSVGLSPAY